jgi:hypothetical protein
MHNWLYRLKYNRYTFKVFGETRISITFIDAGALIKMKP